MISKGANTVDALSRAVVAAVNSVKEDAIQEAVKMFEEMLRKKTQNIGLELAKEINIRSFGDTVTLTIKDMRHD